MRIIAGRAKGHRLEAPQGSATRPMTDRAREALFSSLGAVVVDALVLDLFAGSGALGLEALSRGARRAVFVDIDRRAHQAMRRNMEATRLAGSVVRSDVEDWLTGQTEAVYDLVFVDPPYALSLASVEQLLERIATLCRDDATIVVHRRYGEEPPGAAGLDLISRRRYGDTELFRYEQHQPDGEDSE